MSVLAVLEEIHRADPNADRISLWGHEIEALDGQTLDFLFAQFPGLRQLDLRDNALTQLPPDFGSFVPNLVSLDIRNNPFTSIPELSEALATCTSLQSLHVTLHNKTDEKVLRVMLPSLRLLNGIAVDSDARAIPPPPLTLDLPFSATSSSDGSNSPNHSWLDTPTSVASSSAVRPVRSPQEKRELRIHLSAAAQKGKAAKINKASRLGSPKRPESVKPTELPATISDEKTDWRKLLKQSNDSTSGNGDTTTRAFIAELKAIVRSFQKRSTTTASSRVEDQNLLDQLERKIDLLALQLNDLEKAPNAKGETLTSDGQVMAASLAVRWRLVEAGTLYATHKASSLDRSLGSGLHRLLQTQTQVVEALLKHVHDAIFAHQKCQAASASQAQAVEQQKQQMKLLLDVAETLEKDLEALQTKYQAEKAQREKAESTSKTLQIECDELKKKVDVAAQPTEPAQRRIRKRSEEARPPKEPRPASPIGHTQAKSGSPQRVPSPPRAAANPTILKSLTLKQLVDLIHCILTSKSKYDGRIQAIGAPPETIEQHMYSYLNQRFGLHSLIVEYAAAIWRGCQMYTREDNDVAMFHAMVRNQVDEDFVGIKKKLQQALRELLRAYFHAKFPLKTEAVIQKLVQSRVGGGMIYEEEWSEILRYLYDPSDSSILLRLVKRKAEIYQTQQTNSSKNSNTSGPMQLPFPVFEKLLYDYQLQGRLKLLENFRELFAQFDIERVGVLRQNKFRELVAQLGPRKSEGEVLKMLQNVDPFDHDTVTFSDAVRCLLPDIRQHSINRRAGDKHAGRQVEIVSSKR